MVQNLRVVSIKNFNGGLNLKDDETSLAPGESPAIQNIDVKGTGLSKLPGWQALNDSIPDNVSLEGLFPYQFRNKEWKLISVSYPDIVIIDPVRGNYSYAINQSTGLRYKLNSTGRPFFTRVGDFLGITDGANRPVLLDQNLVCEPRWKPVFTYDNNQAGNVDNSYLTYTTARPGVADIGNPTVSVHHKNRWIVNDNLHRRRLFFSKVTDFISGSYGAFTNLFDANDPTAINIAFFVDVPCKSDIVGLEVISNENLIVYCEREIILMTGENPPGAFYDPPYFSFSVLNDSIGAIDARLITKKGDNDHYFVTNKKTVYQTSLTTNASVQVAPLGLSDKIYPAFENLKTKTLKRGFLVNHRIKGELHFYLPSKDYIRYPDVGYVLNYGDSVDVTQPNWSKVGNFKPFKMRGVTELDYDNQLYLADENQVFKANTGISFAGNDNKTIYQFYTMDFETPKNKKRIIDITLYASSETGATIKFYHLWDDGQAGYTEVTIPATTTSTYGNATYSDSSSSPGYKYVSKAGKSFKETKFKINNRVGKKLKFRLEHSSTTEKWDINEILFRIQPLGQNN